MTAVPKISIITPVWNGLPYLKECVESVLSQDFQEWEMIISDNGSTDGSREYVESMGDPRIRTFNQEKNLGIFGNLNFLFSQALAPITQILCADDYLIPNGLERIFEHWESVPEEVGSIRFNWELLGKGGANLFAHSVLTKKSTPGNSDFRYFLFACAQGNLTNVGVRTNLIKNCGWLREDLPYAGDYEFWTRMGRRYHWIFVEEVVAFVRHHPGQASSYLNKNLELVHQQLAIKMECFSRISERVDGFWLKARGSYQYFRFIHQTFQILLKQRKSGPFFDVWKMADNPMQLPRLLTYSLYLFSMNGRFGEKLVVRKLVQAWNRKNPTDAI